MKRKFNFIIFASLIALGFLVSECSKSKDTVTLTLDPFVVKLGSSTTLGSYLTDKSGSTLYFFAKDASGTNNCTAGCTANWKIFYVRGLTQAKLANGLNLGDFDSISTSGGTQLTYRGWPLYFYAPGGVQEPSGQTGGDGVVGLWFVAKPDYTIMLANKQLVGKDGNNYVVSASNAYSVGLGNTTYFTDQMGRTLYAFAKDSANLNKFTKADFSNNSVWPIFEVTLANVPSVLDKTLFSSTNVFGHSQLTYNARPLYYYGGDLDVNGKFRGSALGVSVGLVPGTWPVLYKDIPAPPAPVAAVTYSVLIQNMAFNPSTITVPVNSTVKWTNMDAMSHTVTATSVLSLGDSGSLGTNGTFSFKFTVAGTYDYKCSIHPSMIGHVIVQ